jgi:hypothetical protein
VLSGVTSAAGYGFFANLGKLSKLPRAARIAEKAAKKKNLTNYWKGQVKNAKAAKAAIPESAAVVAMSEAAKRVVDFPEKKSSGCD